MTGPEHYREAERLLAAAEVAPDVHVSEVQQAAQVHATLALAAATAMVGDMTSGEWPGWREAAGSTHTRGDAS